MPVVLVVGSSRELGRELVEEHLRRGWEVATSRPGAIVTRVSRDDTPAMTGAT